MTAALSPCVLLNAEVDRITPIFGATEFHPSPSPENVSVDTRRGVVFLTGNG
jgi:hypothetical protein